MKQFVLCVIFLAVVVPLKDIYISLGSMGFYYVFRLSITRSMLILTCACPCALGIAIPSAVVVAANFASQKGILITKGFSTFQKLCNTRSTIFDKTGTQTRATLGVASSRKSNIWREGEKEFWIYVCAVEENSVTTHPICRAIFSAGVTHLSRTWLEHKSLLQTQHIASESGKGVSGEVSIRQQASQHVIIGSLRYLQSCGISLLPDKPQRDDHGGILVYVGIDSCFAGTLLITDAVRDDAENTIKELHMMGCENSLLTGDVAQSARRVSQLINIAVLGSEVTPQDKLAVVMRLQKDGEVVTMAGDRVNDVPSLSTANVGIALYHEAATPTVGNSVVILNSRLDSIPLLLKIAKHTVQQVQFNIA
ncbi:Fc.00g000800.m01.CDS01 [Cosmosporella sp. VM-42]